MSQLSIFPLVSHVAIRVDLPQRDQTPGQPHQDSVHQEAVRRLHSSVARSAIGEKRTGKITLVRTMVFELVRSACLRESINVIVVLIELDRKCGRRVFYAIGGTF